MSTFWVGLLSLLGGLVIGNARGVRKAQAAEKEFKPPPLPPPPFCDLTSVAEWATSRGVKGAVVADRTALERIGAPTDRFTVMITQSDCTVHGWDGAKWMVDSTKTEDMQRTTGFSEIGL